MCVFINQSTVCGICMLVFLPFMRALDYRVSAGSYVVVL